jgi:hypothetical protein
MAGEVVLPLSLTDLAKSLRELLGLTNDVSNLAGKVSSGLTQRKRSGAAQVLGKLGFSPHGSKGVLARIAGGRGSQADLDELKRKLAETDSEIDAAIARLTDYGPFLEQQLGLNAKWELEDLIYQAGLDEDGFMGKRDLRRELRALSELNYVDDPPAAQSHAQRLLGSIERFNKSLLEMYERIRSAAP